MRIPTLRTSRVKTFKKLLTDKTTKLASFQADSLGPKFECENQLLLLMILFHLAAMVIVIIH